MPTNTQVTAALVLTATVPPDQDCPPATKTEWLQAAVDYLGVASQDPDSPSSQTNSVADQALVLANQAISQVNELKAATPARRTSGSNLIQITTTGDSTGSVTFAPDMPSVNYGVNFTIHGPATATTGPDIFVVDGSRAVNGFQVRIVNVPVTGSWYYSYEAVEL